jgi:hypothetical protein
LIQYFDRQKEKHAHQHSFSCSECAKIACINLPCAEKYNCNFLRSMNK